MIELKPCPFCGKEKNLLLRTEMTERWEALWVILCTNCQVKMLGDCFNPYAGDGKEGRGLLVERWNERRTDENIVRV